MKESREPPRSTKLELSDVNFELSSNVHGWLKKRGKVVKPKLPDEKKAELREVFKMMDGDGSGAIDVDELGAAFKLLGFDLTRSQVSDMVNEVDHDGTGEVEYDEFLEVMTVSLLKLTNETQSQGNANQVPFELVATAYKRKKLMEGVVWGTQESWGQILQERDEAMAAAEKERQAAEVKTQQRLAAAKAACRADYSHLSPHCALMQASEACQVKASLLKETLSPEELKAVAGVVVKQARQQRTKSDETGWRHTVPAKLQLPDSSSRVSHAGAAAGFTCQQQLSFPRRFQGSDSSSECRQQLTPARAANAAAAAFASQKLLSSPRRTCNSGSFEGIQQQLTPRAPHSSGDGLSHGFHRLSHGSRSSFESECQDCSPRHSYACLSLPEGHSQSPRHSNVSASCMELDHLHSPRPLCASNVSNSDAARQSTAVTNHLPILAVHMHHQPEPGQHNTLPTVPVSPRRSLVRTDAAPRSAVGRDYLAPLGKLGSPSESGNPPAKNSSFSFAVPASPRGLVPSSDVMVPLKGSNLPRSVLRSLPAMRGAKHDI